MKKLFTIKLGENINTNLGLIACLPLILLGGCATQEMKGPYLCPPDNRPVFVYSDPSKLYQNVVTSYEVTAKGLKATLEEYKAEFGLGEIEVQSETLLLQDKLKQNGIILKNNLKTIAYLQQSDPCVKEYKTQLFSYLDKVNQQELALENIRVKLTEQIESKNKETSVEVIKNIDKNNDIIVPAPDASTQDDVDDNNQVKKKNMI